MKEIKTQKGITLIALIITIIVLLILAVVAIAAIQDSDILLHADRSAIMHEVGTISEKIRLESQALKLAGAASPDNAIAQTGGNALKSLYARYDNEEYAAVELKTIKLDETKTESIPEITDFTKDYHVVMPEKLNYDISRGKDVDITNLRTEDIFVVDDEFNVYYLITLEVQTVTPPGGNPPGGGDSPGGESVGALPADDSLLTIGSIEDLVDFAMAVNGGSNFAGQTITLETSLDFEDKNSYRMYKESNIDPSVTKYIKGGVEIDANGDDNTQPLMTEMIGTKADDGTREGVGFTPIGQIIGDFESVNMFSGTFEGNGNTISGLYSNNMNTQSAGLFGVVSTDAKIKNLTLANANTLMNGMVGIILDLSGNGTTLEIENCNLKNVDINNDGGYASGYGIGFIGSISIKNSHLDSDCSIIGRASAGFCFDMMGGTTYTIEGCTNAATITGDNIAGILTMGSEGEATEVKIIGCENTGLLEADVDASEPAAAGILNMSKSTRYEGKSVVIDNCINKGNITGDAYAAGIYMSDGYDEIYAINCVNTGTIEGFYVAGIADCGNVYNCYNLGQYTAQRSLEGGLIYYVTKNSTVKNSYTIGASETDIDFTDDKEGNIVIWQHCSELTGNEDDNQKAQVLKVLQDNLETGWLNWKADETTGYPIHIQEEN